MSETTQSKKRKNVNIADEIKNAMINEKSNKLTMVRDKIYRLREELKQAEEEAPKLVDDLGLFIIQENDEYRGCLTDLDETYRIMSTSVLKDGFWDKDENRGLAKGTVEESYFGEIKVKLNVPNPLAAKWIGVANNLNVREEKGEFGRYPRPTNKNLKTYNVVITKLH